MLGRIKDAGARTSLIRRLKRLASGAVPTSGANDLAYALWRKRHPDLIPVVRSVLEQLPAEDSWALRALLRLLETAPEALSSWILDASAPLTDKRKVLTILDEEVPDELLPILPALISTGVSLGDSAVKQDGEASRYCDRLFIMLLMHHERVLPGLPAEARAELYALAKRCVASVDPSCSLRAAHMLHEVGGPGDAPLIEAHRPEDPGLARKYDDIARALRNRSTH